MSMLTLKQLEALIWIVRLGTFERAADRLNTTQSAISKRIQELEALAASPLLDRSRRGTGLTLRGEALLPLAERMLGLRDEISAVLGLPTPLPPLRLGVTELSAMTWLPAFVAALQEAEPDCRLEPEVGGTGQDLLTRLRARQLDLVVAPEEFEGADPRLEHRPLAGVRFDWMASPSLDLPDRVLDPQDLESLTLLCQDERHGTGRWILDWRRRCGFAPRRTVPSNNLSALAGLAVSGLGITYLPHGCFPDLEARGLLRRLETTFPPPEVPYALSYRRGDDITPALHETAVALIDRCCDFTRPMVR
jgi:DNA-binding transcriptional LysR family regulator